MARLPVPGELYVNDRQDTSIFILAVFEDKRTQYKSTRYVIQYLIVRKDNKFYPHYQFEERGSVREEENWPSWWPEWRSSAL